MRLDRRHEKISEGLKVYQSAEGRQLSYNAPPMRPSAFLSDLDGTLVETHEAWSAATRIGLDTHDVALTEDEYASLAHLLLTDFLRQKGYVQEMIDRVRAERDRHLPAFLRTHAQWLPGAPELLATVRKRPTGIVTNSHRLAVDILEEALGVRRAVRTVITSDDVSLRRKPDPYPLLLAAEQLGVEPSECLYLGDLPVDLIAANEAGMHSCLIRRPHTPPDADRYARHIVEHLKEVPALLE